MIKAQIQIIIEFYKLNKGSDLKHFSKSFNTPPILLTPLMHQKISKEETAQLLTESENHLKQILIKSLIFLNTAEALFKT